MSGAARFVGRNSSNRRKPAGRGRSQVFTGEMRSEVMAQLRRENDIRRAVERHEFEVYYQTIVSLPSSEITGIEALTRILLIPASPTDS